MPAAPRSCLHTHGGQDGGRDLYRGLQHHPAGLERDYEQEFISGICGNLIDAAITRSIGNVPRTDPVPAPLLRASIRLQQGRTGPPGCRQRRRASRPRRGRSLNDVFDGSSSFTWSPRKRFNPGSGAAWRSGELGGNWRLLMEPDPLKSFSAVVVTVIDIYDYH